MRWENEFTPTDKEKIRVEFDKLSEYDGEEQPLTREEFENAVSRMRKAKR